MINKQSTVASEMALTELTPKYVEEHHKVYVDALLKAVDDCVAKNIALAGQFGTGKSSVLAGLVDRLAKERPKVGTILVSLSTLDADRASVRVQDAPEGDVPAVTNLIQKEIVKQLVYRERPTRMPRSRYRRLWATRWWQVLIGGLILAVIAWLVTRIALGEGPVTAVDGAPWGAAVAAAAISVLWWRLSGRVSVSELKSGSASLSLKDAGSWFDQYLDEIIYFFDQTRCRVVIFEDLDRFKDPHIFETLRELNVLLNSMTQLKDKKTGPIRFIYAARDSVFTPKSTTAKGSPDIGAGAPGDAASPAANRIKFFDLVVPMVPFVTPQTARGHLIEQLKHDKHPPSEEVIDVVAHDITDMRLIVNIANEYAVFSTAVLGAGRLTELTADRLFAMIVYKNLYPDDFEKIMAGTSRLNLLYKASRHAVEAIKTNLNTDLARLDRTIHDHTLSPAECDRVGAQLASMTTNLGLSLSAGAATFAGSNHGDQAFWKQVLDDQSLHVRFSTGHRSLISWKNMCQMLGIGDPDLWLEADHDSLKRERAKTAGLLEEVTRANMAFLLARDDLIYTDPVGADGVPFSGRMEILLPCMGLAHELLRRGYIDEYFTLYTGRYHSKGINASAQNFLMLTVYAPGAEPNVDYQFTNPAVDIPLVLQQAGPSFLRDNRCLNLQVFDYLLTHRVPGDHSIDVLTTQHPTAADFMKRYLDDGAQAELLVRRLAQAWRPIFTYIAGRNEPANKEMIGWVSAALAAAKADLDYETNTALVTLIRENWATMPTLTSASSGTDAAVLAKVLTHLGLRAPDLSILPEELQCQLVGLDGYDITLGNLAVAARTDHLPSFDELNEHVSDYVLRNLDAYAQILQDNPGTPSVRSQESVVQALERVAPHTKGISPSLQDVFSKTAGGGTVPMVESFKLLWPSLARTQRFEPSLAALQVYRKEYPNDGLDAWAAVLTEKDVIAPEGQTATHDLALAVLAMSAVPEKRRVELLVKMGIDDLPVSMLNSEEARLIPELVQAGAVADDAAAFTHLQSLGDQQALKEFVSVSTEFPEFLEEIEPTEHGLQCIADSGNDSAIQAVLGSNHALSAVTPGQVSFWVATARQKAFAVHPDALLVLAHSIEDPGAEAFAALLAREGTRATAPQFRNILDVLPAPYSRVGHETTDLPASAEALVDVAKQHSLIAKSRRVSGHIRTWVGN